MHRESGATRTPQCRASAPVERGPSSPWLVTRMGVPCGRPHRLSQRSDPAGVTSYSYGPSTGRLASVTDPFTASAGSLTYADADRILPRDDPTGLSHCSASSFLDTFSLK